MVRQSGMRAGSTLLRMLAEGRSYSGRERNVCYLNTGADERAQGQFANISSASGLDLIDDGRGIALVDWDHDGDLDMWNSNRNGPRLRFLRNNIDKNNRNNGQAHSVTLRLVGNGITCNRDGIGARIELVCSDDEKKSIRTVRAGDGFLSQSSKSIVVGLGSTTSVEKVIVQWPGNGDEGEPEEFTLNGVDKRYELAQGTGIATELTGKRDVALSPSTPDVPGHSPNGRVGLQVLLQAPEIRYKDFDERNRFKPPAGKTLLVNLWSSSCVPCVRELTEFSQRADELRAEGIEVVALSLDQLEDDGSISDAKRLLEQTGLPFDSGLVTAELMDQLQGLHDHLMPLHNALTIPTSFIIDEKGLLSVIYKGPVTVDQLIKDRLHSSGDSLTRFANSGALPGSTIDHPVINESIHRLEAGTRDLFAKRLERDGKMEQAVAQYREIIKLKPDYPYAHHVIGNWLTERNRLPDARMHYLNSLKVLPDDVNIHTALANVFIRENNMASAEHHCREAVRIEPESSEFRVNLGNIFLQQQKADEAQRHYEEAIRLDSNNAQARHNLGTIFYQQNKLAQAKEQFEQAIRIQPNYAQAHFNLASIYELEENYVRAKDHYEAALTHNPNFAQARAGLSRVLQQMRGGQ